MTDIDKIRSFEKQQEILNILHSEDPDHYSRLWMAGFLKFVGYTQEEICSLVDEECCWSDYDARITWSQVSSLFRRDYPSRTHISSLVPTECGVAPHGVVQLSILSAWQKGRCGNGTLEYEVLSNGYGLRGFIDVVLFWNDLKIGVEVDKASPTFKSIFKMQYVDIAVFVLRSSHITEYRRYLIESKLESFDKPFLLVLLCDGMIINRIPEHYNFVSLFFRNWFAGKEWKI